MDLSTPAGIDAQMQASIDFAEQKIGEHRDQLRAKIAYLLDVSVPDLLLAVGSR